MGRKENQGTSKANPQGFPEKNTPGTKTQLPHLQGKQKRRVKGKPLGDNTKVLESPRSIWQKKRETLGKGGIAGAVAKGVKVDCSVKN